MNKSIKAVVWPRGPMNQPEDKPTVYRYVIVGMIVTDRPIEEWEGQNELVLDGPVEAIPLAPSRQAKMPTGEASSVLCKLGDL